MKSRYVGNVGWWLAMTTMLLGAALLAPAASSSIRAADESPKAARLFRGIEADAAKVRSGATGLDRLAASPDAKWLDYDRQWNEIKPAVEDMQIKVARLEAMRTAISPAQRKEVDQSKMLIGGIQNMTFELRMLLDEPGIHTSDAKFRVYGSSLRNVARQLEKTASAS